VGNIKTDIQETWWRTRTGLIWLRTETCGRQQQTWRNFGFDKRCRVCQLANKLLASQEGNYSMHLCKEKPTWCILYTNISRCIVNKT
jgi:hypothetical protein